ncbi:MAG: periplasmic heavy metal sensor [Desulfobacterales bacterium]|nr:periplasmic heavy metal sensor [Desulfobacterales bacterium]
MKLSNKIIIAIAVLATIGFAGYAFAHGGYGNRGWNGDHMGYGPHMGYGQHMGYYGNEGYSGLSESEIEKIDKSRDDFYKSTEKSRETIYQKRIELRNELSNTNPNTKKLKTIQKELSKLEADLDQKTLDYEVEINKIAPNKRSGFAGRGFGNGRSGDGYCWD